MNDDKRFPAVTAAEVSVRPLLTVDRVAFLTSLSPATIRRAVRDGRLACVRIGRSVRIRPEDLDLFTHASNGEHG